MDIVGELEFTPPREISRGETVVVEGVFDGRITIQMATRTGDWITVHQTRRPGRFENRTASTWRVRAGFLEGDHIAGTVLIGVGPPAGD